MIRSFHYAAFTALLETTVIRPEDRPIAEPWADAWYRWVSGAYLRAYLEATAGMPFVATPEDQPLILDTHLIRKALHELRDELDHGAQTAAIPLAALVELAGCTSDRVSERRRRRRELFAGRGTLQVPKRPKTRRRCRR